MKLILQRYSDNGNSTQGLMFLLADNIMTFINYTLEDENRKVKVKGETCIPAGLYEIVWRKTVSPKTASYRGKFNWFEWHMMLKDVEGFEYVYIHIGNDEGDTDGCILVQDAANNNQVAKGFNSLSTPAFTRLYNMVADALMNEDKVFLEVRELLQ